MKKKDHYDCNMDNVTRGIHPWIGKIPWRRKWQLTQVFLPGESHGQRSLTGYSPWNRKESDTTKQTEQNNRHGGPEVNFSKTYS